MDKSITAVREGVRPFPGIYSLAATLQDDGSRPLNGLRVRAIHSQRGGSGRESEKWSEYWVPLHEVRTPSEAAFEVAKGKY